MTRAPVRMVGGTEPRTVAGMNQGWSQEGRDSGA